MTLGFMYVYVFTTHPDTTLCALRSNTTALLLHRVYFHSVIIHKTLSITAGTLNPDTLDVSQLFLLLKSIQPNRSQLTVRNGDGA